MAKRKDEAALVKVATATSETEANILTDALWQEGIRAHIKNRNPLLPVGMPSAITSSFEIYVLARHEKRARWVIGERED